MKTGNTAGIRSFAKSAAKAASLGAASTLALGATGALAQTRDTVVVTGERAAEMSSPRYTAPLLDTPQTVTVVSSELIEEQNLLNLRDILATVPGITFGAGEGGGGYGDSINLRGYSANGDITTDGVRDSAQYSRTDPFNLEQVEVTNGANSVYGGAGAVGGSINIATKRPLDMDRTILGLGFGTDSYGRATLDMNQTWGERVSTRLNLMAHSNNVPDRDVEKYDRWGVAPGVAFDLTDSTKVTLLYVHQEDDNIPQYGVPYALNAYSGGLLAGADRSNYYGYANVDTQQINLDSATLIVDHAFNPNLTLRNLTRWSEVSQYAVINALQGTWCVTPGINPYTGAACAPAGVYAPGGPRGNLRDGTNWILANQTDLTARFATGGLAHTLVVGAAFSEEKFKLDSGNIQRTAAGATPAYPPMSIADPDNIYTGPLNRTISSVQSNSVSNAALYAFDRIELGPQWEINGGLRYEHNEGDAQSYGIAAGTGVVTVNAPTANEDDLFSYRVGVVYKPVERASLYVAYGNSQTPSQATVNGSCTATTCNVDPEEAQNYEIGGKYEAFGGRILLTAAVFRNQRSQFRVDSGIPGVQQVLDGSSKVDGVSLGAAGLITENWSVFANYTYLDSELEQSVSDVSLAGGALDFRAGDPLPNTPEHAASLWTTYEVENPGLTFGYGVTYQGEYTFNRFDATSPLYYTDAYWVHRAMVAWDVTDRARLQLNVNNLFNEEYFERIRNNAGNGWATPGAARSAVLSLQYRF